MADHQSDNRIYYQGEFEIYRGERLPHWEVADGIYFATFRLADAIPTATAERLAERYRAMMEALEEEGSVGTLLEGGYVRPSDSDGIGAGPDGEVHSEEPGGRRAGGLALARGR